MPILNSWPEIAGFLKVSVNTAKDYAERRGLPVRREGGAVLASRRALILWVEGTWQSPCQSCAMRGSDDPACGE